MSNTNYDDYGNQDSSEFDFESSSYNKSSSYSGGSTVAQAFYRAGTYFMFRELINAGYNGLNIIWRIEKETEKRMVQLGYDLSDIVNNSRDPQFREDWDNTMLTIVEYAYGKLGDNPFILTQYAPYAQKEIASWFDKLDLRKPSEKRESELYSGSQDFHEGWDVGLSEKPEDRGWSENWEYDFRTGQYYNPLSRWELNKRWRESQKKYWKTKPWYLVDEEGEPYSDQDFDYARYGAYGEGEEY